MQVNLILCLLSRPLDFGKFFLDFNLSWDMPCLKTLISQKSDALTESVSGDHGL